MIPIRLVTATMLGLVMVKAAIVVVGVGLVVGVAVADDRTSHPGGTTATNRGVVSPEFLERTSAGPMAAGVRLMTNESHGQWWNRRLITLTCRGVIVCQGEWRQVISIRL